MYCPLADGNESLMANTTHEGTTRLFPRPNFPNLHMIYCLYPAFRKLSIVKSNSSARKSHRALIHTSSMSLSKQIFENVFSWVIQFTLLQHTFSTSVSIGRHRRHVHHWGAAGSGGGGGFDAAPIKFFAKSRQPRPIHNSSVGSGLSDWHSVKQWRPVVQTKI